MELEHGFDDVIIKTTILDFKASTVATAFVRTAEIVATFSALSAPQTQAEHNKINNYEYENCCTDC